MNIIFLSILLFIAVFLFLSWFVRQKTKKIEHDAYAWATIEQIRQIANSEIPIYLLEKALEMSKNAK